MSRPTCSRSEDIVRALCDAHWDADKNRYSSSLFTGPNSSVSRLVIFSLDILFEIFHRDLDKPHSKVKAVGEINVGKLQDTCNNHAEPITITVEIDPLPENEAHAVIPQKIPRGLAHKIIKELRIHTDLSGRY